MAGRKPQNVANPVLKIISISKQLNTSIELLLENADNKDFVKALVDLREQLLEEEKKRSNMDNHTKEIAKILEKYNHHISKMLLTILKGKLSEYKNIGVLETYMEKPVQIKKATLVKSIASEEVAMKKKFTNG